MTCLVNRSGSVPFRVTAEAFISCDFIGGCPAAVRFDLPPGELLDLSRINTDVSKLGWQVQVRWENGEPYRRDRCQLHIHNPVAAFASKEDRLAGAATVHVHSLAGLTDTDVGPGIAEITDERRRQITELGHTRDSDLHYTGDRTQDLIKAAAFYLSHGGVSSVHPQTATYVAEVGCGGCYPWGDEVTVSEDPIVNLAKAGALIAAEIDRQQAFR